MQDQSALAAANPSNPLLRYRGNAGTHDLKLGTDTLMTLRDLTQSGQSAAVPRWGANTCHGQAP
jgi:D-glycerate 3-kinase